jgi:hypothetical protein
VLGVLVGLGLVVEQEAFRMQVVDTTLDGLRRKGMPLEQQGGEGQMDGV